MGARRARRGRRGGGGERGRPRGGSWASGPHRGIRPPEPSGPPAQLDDDPAPACAADHACSDDPARRGSRPSGRVTSGPHHTDVPSRRPSDRGGSSVVGAAARSRHHGVPGRHLAASTRQRRISAHRLCPRHPAGRPSVSAPANRWPIRSPGRSANDQHRQQGARIVAPARDHRHPRPRRPGAGRSPACPEQRCGRRRFGRLRNDGRGHERRQSHRLERRRFHGEHRRVTRSSRS